MHVLAHKKICFAYKEILSGVLRCLRSRTGTRQLAICQSSQAASGSTPGIGEWVLLKLIDLGSRVPRLWRDIVP